MKTKEEVIAAARKIVGNAHPHADNLSLCLRHHGGINTMAEISDLLESIPGMSYPKVLDAINTKYQKKNGDIRTYVDANKTRIVLLDTKECITLQDFVDVFLTSSGLS